MSINFEYRTRERQSKRESGRQASEAQREKGRRRFKKGADSSIIFKFMTFIALRVEMVRFSCSQPLSLFYWMAPTIAELDKMSL